MIWFFLGLLAVVAIVGALYWRWSRRVEAEVAEGAEIEWARLQESDPDLLQGMDRAKFDVVYRRVHFPRFPAYALACLCAFAASLPLTFGILAAGSLIWERIGLSPNTPAIADRYLVEEGRMRIITAAPPEAAMYVVEDFARFYYFFGVVAVWLLIVAYFMRRYHGRRPGYLRDEIIRAR
jgi:hypothetical protein